MALQFVNIPLPKSQRTVTSKYNFGDLKVGGPALSETEVIDAKKASSKITSALVAYRARTGDAGKFSVRIYNNPDGTQAVGVWRVSDAPAAPAA